MKITYVSQAILPSEESHSLSIMKMCQVFSEHGHDVNLIGIRPQGEYIDPKEFYGLNGKFKIDTFYYRPLLTTFRIRNILHSYNIKKIINKEKPDIIYARLCVPSLKYIPSDIPIIFELHSPSPVSGLLSNRKDFEKLINRNNFKRIIVTTEILKNYLSEKYPDKEIVLARLSAELPPLLNKKELSEFKKNNLCGSNVFHVGYTGFLDNYGLRGTDIICKIAQKMPDINFHVVGGTDEMVVHWRNYAKSKNIYFYGYKNPNMIPWYLQSFDVVLAPLQLQKTKRRPFGKNMSPLKIPQYFANQCAIVASNVPAHMEMLEDQKNAIICEPDDINKWTESINLLRKDQSLRNIIRKTAFKNYLSEYTPSVRLEKILYNIECQ